MNGPKLVNPSPLINESLPEPPMLPSGSFPFAMRSNNFSGINYVTTDQLAVSSFPEPTAVDLNNSSLNPMTMMMNRLKIHRNPLIPQR